MGDGCAADRRLPSISLISPTLNRRDMLREALSSAVGVPRNALEIIVVDGGSTDGTVDTARDFGALVIDDRRQGLYAALNLGIAAASGDVVGFLNSDDLLAAGALQTVREAFAAHPDAHGVCGQAELFDATGRRAFYGDTRDLRLDAHAALVGAAILNARFLRRDALAALPRFDPSFPLVADRRFLAECVARDVFFLPVTSLVYRYRSHPGSKTFATPRASADLRHELLRLAGEVRRAHPKHPQLARKAAALDARCRFQLGLCHLRRKDWHAARRCFATSEGMGLLGLVWRVARDVTRPRE